MRLYRVLNRCIAGYFIASQPPVGYKPLMTKMTKEERGNYLTMATSCKELCWWWDCHWCTRRMEVMIDNGCSVVLRGSPRALARFYEKTGLVDTNEFSSFIIMMSYSQAWYDGFMCIVSIITRLFVVLWHDAYFINLEGGGRGKGVSKYTSSQLRLVW